MLFETLYIYLPAIHVICKASGRTLSSKTIDKMYNASVNVILIKLSILLGVS